VCGVPKTQGMPTNGHKSVTVETSLPLYFQIRCDRKVPCEQCKRRGCSSICPEGQLVPGKGRHTRMILCLPNVDDST
jgi:Fe-S-cluster-containing hydrogenase component 2